MRHRPKNLDELAAVVAAAAPDDIVEPVPPEPPGPGTSVERLFQALGINLRQSTPEEIGRWRRESDEREREKDAARERLHSLPEGFRMMRELPFADLEPFSDEADGVVVVTDEWRRALVVIGVRHHVPEETRELPAWWYRWELRDVLTDEAIDFVPTLWAPLPR